MPIAIPAFEPAVNPVEVADEAAITPVGPGPGPCADSVGTLAVCVATSESAYVASIA